MSVPCAIRTTSFLLLLGLANRKSFRATGRKAGRRQGAVVGGPEKVRSVAKGQALRHGGEGTTASRVGGASAVASQVGGYRRRG